MDNNRVKELEEIEKRFKARNKYNTDYQKNKYDRTVILLDKGQKQIVDNIAKRKGFKSITEYVKFLIDQDLNNSNFQDFQQEETYNSFSDGSGLPFGWFLKKCYCNMLLS